jgi:membrane protein implicated in regulation of membrane protease activity
MKKQILVFAMAAAVVMVLSMQHAAQAQESTPAQEPGTVQEPAMVQETTTVQEPTNLQVEVGTVCREVIDRAPVEAGNSFPASVGKLFCFTKITGALNPTRVTHVWSFDGNERARVELEVNSASWRTYSSKNIENHEVGAWSVEVVDSAGNVLQTLNFEVTPS